MTIYLTLIKTKTYTDKIISFGMWLWATLRGLPVGTTYGHMEIRFGDFTIGATAKGIAVNEWDEYTIAHVSKYLAFPVELTTGQEVIFHDYLKDTKNLKYEFENFWWHFIKIITGNWFGDKTSKKIYCFEYGLTLLIRLGYNVDIYMNPYECKIHLMNTKYYTDGYI